MISAPTYVYFIRRVDGEGPIKIGCSDAPASRLQNLMFWSPVDLDLLVAIPGTIRLEGNIHDCFFHDYLRHEWFKTTPRLLDLVTSLRAGVPIEQALDLTKRLGNVRTAGRSAYRRNNIPDDVSALRRHRLSTGLTQSDFASVLGVSLGTLCGWEKGKKPSADSALKIERLTNGSVTAGALRPDLWPTPCPA